MPRKRGGPTNIEKRRKEGYGAGEGANYKPWLTVRSVPTHGLAHRIFGLTTNRVHHLLSNWELGCFLLLDHRDVVTDIREQYPLHPLIETQDIADQLGYRHPMQRRTRKGVPAEQPIIMTTDFLVSLSAGAGAPEMAIAVKPSDKLNSRRTLEKLEIERRYWERREIPWRLVTEHELPRALTDNLQFLGPFYSLEDYDLPHDEIPELLNAIRGIIAGAPTVALNVVCRDADRDLGLPTGGALTLTWHALATQVWRAELRVPLNPDKPLVILSARSNME
jgi:hypothetical protein